MPCQLLFHIILIFSFQIFSILFSKFYSHLYEFFDDFVLIITEGTQIGS